MPPLRVRLPALDNTRFRLHTESVTMKVPDLTVWAVVTADQRNSRRAADRVPAALSTLDAVAGDRLALPFERTAGDEIQGLAATGAAVVASIVALTRLDGWRIGIGVGAVDRPLPTSTRAARGDAYLAARTAISSARRNPVELPSQVVVTVWWAKP